MKTPHVKLIPRSPLRLGLLLIPLVLAALALSAPAWADPPGQCSTSTLKGAYMSEQSGTLNGLPLVQVNRIVADGQGGFTGSGTVVVNGVVSTVAITATYTVNSDCTGTLTSVPAGLSQNFVVKDDGSQVFFIVTAHPAGAATLAGEAVRLSKK
jgi:hypothetical protein